MYRLSVNLNYFNREIDKLVNLQDNIYTLPAQYQKLVAEVVLLRLFSLFQETIFSISCKIICRTQYFDGSIPQVMINCPNIQNAKIQMQNYGRSKTLYNLNWSKASEIKRNLKYLLDLNDHFIKTIDIYGAFIDELRRIRNRIAHNNSKSRQDYQIIVQRYYGAKLNGLSPGTLLISSRQNPNLLQQYLLKSKILVKELMKG